jgi:hypothetical protein
MNLFNDLNYAFIFKRCLLYLIFKNEFYTFIIII